MSNLTHDEMTLSPDAVSERPQRGILSYTRVYRRRGKYAHLLEAVISTGCQKRSEDDYLPDQLWLGTGSQAEYDRAAALPLCVRCFRWREVASHDHRLGTGHGRACV